MENKDQQGLVIDWDHSIDCATLDELRSVYQKLSDYGAAELAELVASRIEEREVEEVDE